MDRTSTVLVAYPRHSIRGHANAEGGATQSAFLRRYRTNCWKAFWAACAGTATTPRSSLPTVRCAPVSLLSATRKLAASVPPLRVPCAWYRRSSKLGYIDASSFRFTVASI